MNLKLNLNLGCIPQRHLLDEDISLVTLQKFFEEYCEVLMHSDITACTSCVLKFSYLNPDGYLEILLTTYNLKIRYKDKKMQFFNMSLKHYFLHSYFVVQRDYTSLIFEYKKK